MSEQDENPEKEFIERERRKRPINYLEAYHQDSNLLFGNVVDVTNSGIKLTCQTELKIDQTYAIRLRLTNPINGVNEISLECRCCWIEECKASLLRGSYFVGFEITNLTDETVELIDGLLHSSWFKDWRELPDYEAVRKETEENTD